jgi:hypothetical protein
MSFASSVMVSASAGCAHDLVHRSEFGALVPNEEEPIRGASHPDVAHGFETHQAAELPRPTPESSMQRVALLAAKQLATCRRRTTQVISVPGSCPDSSANSSNALNAE